MDYENVYYVDGRNATVTPARDHRVITTGPVNSPVPITRVVTPTTNVAWASPNSAPYQYPAPTPSYYGPTVYPNTTWNPSINWGYPAQPPYVVPPVTAPPSNLATILGGFGDVGTLANIVAQAIAAFLPLPAAPNPQDATGSEDAATSAATNSSNLIRYQNALAMFARRDQQILTLGSVLKELFRRPNSVFG
jgi:hypothetical protein